MKYNHELNANLREACKTSASADDNDRLYQLVASGDADARQQMITNNMPLVISLVESYLSSRPDYAYLQDDLVAEGFLRIVEVVEHFASGRKVSNPTSYLSRSIRRHIHKNAKQSQLIHTPPNINSPRILTNLDASKMKMGDRSRSTDSVDLRDILTACCESDDERAILNMREQGFTFREIARSIRVSLNTAHTMYVAIRDRFDSKMRELQQ